MSRNKHARSVGGRRPWLLAATLVIVWLIIAGATGPFAGKLGDVQTNENAAFLPSSAEATEVVALQQKFRDQSVNPAVLVYVAPGGLTSGDRRQIAADARRLADLPQVVGHVAGPIPSKDGKAAEILVPLDGNLSGAALSKVVGQIRSQVRADSPTGLHAYVTGPAGFAADLVHAFAGIDGILLLVALLVVLIILVVVYRSPLLPIIVLVSALFALSIASGAVYYLADAGAITLNGQSQGILFILVVGAATDYALLLTARFREELREHRSRFEAITIAWRQSATTILASGLTVILALLCLLFSNLNSTSSLGPVAALGIAGALLAALTFLPAVLALVGRAAFWPIQPRYGSEHPEQSGLWGQIASTVGRHPRRIWLGTGAVLVILAAFTPTLRSGGAPQSDLFLNPVQSAAGQRALGRHFPAGAGSPVIIIGPADKVSQLVGTARNDPGISTAAAIGPGGTPVTAKQSPKTVDGLVQVQATLRAPADSDAAVSVAKRVRTAEHTAVPGSKVGGFTATTLDTRTTARHDRAVIIPIVLVVILVLLALLLRAILAPILLLISVVLSFAATLGVSALVFNHLLHFPAADPAVPLYAFIFLVALGIDYNIFLMSRGREESRRRGTRAGMLRALSVTGGVITSAGVVLAATFSALSVIPLLFLAQIAFIVAFGVLLDTLVVRSLLVPALMYDLGPRIWWPGRLAVLHRSGRSGDGPSQPRMHP